MDTLLTPALTESIEDAIGKGVSIPCVCAAAGIAESTLRRWIQRGRGDYHKPPKQIHIDFVRAIERGRARDEMNRVERINASAEGGQLLEETIIPTKEGDKIVRKYARPDPRCDMFMLERRYPSQYGPVMPTPVDQIGDGVDEAIENGGDDSESQGAIDTAGLAADIADLVVALENHGDEEALPPPRPAGDGQRIHPEDTPPETS